MAWTIAAIVVALLWLRQSVLVMLAAALVLLYAVYDAGHAEYVIYDVWEALNREALLIFPLFVLGSSVLARGLSAHRLVDLLLVLTKPLPGGIACAGVVSIALVAALFGSPVVALLVTGPLLYRAMLEYGCGQTFVVGLLCSGAMVGVLLPPSISLLVYGAITELPLGELYRQAAVVASLLLGTLVLCSVAMNWRSPREAWYSAEIRRTLLRALPLLSLFGVLFGGIYSRVLMPVQAATLFLFGALLVESVFYRAVRLRELGDTALDVCRQLGRVLPLIAFSVSLSAFLRYQQLPDELAAMAVNQELARSEFLVAINLLLLAAGTVMDSTTSLVLLAPVLQNMPAIFDIEPVAFGVMAVGNLGLSYLTPPTGAVLIAAMVVFKENFLAVVKAVAPFLAGFIVVLFVLFTQFV